VLSRLIALLHRIPAVKWAFTKLRPLPRSDAEIAVAALPTEDDATVSVVAELAPPEIAVSDVSPRAAPVDVEPMAVEAISTDVDRETIEVAGPVLAGDISSDCPTELETVLADEAPLPSDDIESIPAELAAVIVDADSAPDVSIGAVVTAEAPDVLADDAGPVADVIVAGTDTAPSATADVAPKAPSDAPRAEAAGAEDDAANSDAIVASLEPPPPPVSLAPTIAAAAKAPAKAAEPLDRAALIRRRWAETGIRMWNPRLHGTGDAALNIQGRVELLPPAPGETMPRYDKLEFRMLGGQIVCEGVIVEAPVQASQRSFTRLAEPRSTERMREPVRERQAALA
jgi:hypothetical protein